MSASARGLAAALVASALVAPSLASRAAELRAPEAPPRAARGVVFVDADGDGIRDEGERGVAGVVVWRGARYARTDARGRYALPAPRPQDVADVADDLVWVTRPSGFDCARWYRPKGGDFALVPSAADDASFVFAHVSDVHIADRREDFARHAVPTAIAAMPLWLAGRSMSIVLGAQGGGVHSSGEIADALRRAWPEGPPAARVTTGGTVGEWLQRVAALADGTGATMPIAPARDLREALREVAAFAPRFVASTGDLVLEGNEVEAPTAARWMDFYLAATRATGMRFRETIGNNELVGTALDAVDADAPGFGKATFRVHFGPTAYSFDEGALHFVALDTHRATNDARDDWSFFEMEPRVRAWLDADLAAHAGRTVVVLNHEPFVVDPAWPLALRLAPTVGALGELGIRGVAVTFSGHFHASGSALERGDGATTQHVMTGGLSGARWVFPASAVPRGYRLVQVRGDAIYSAWKATGEPLLGFVVPAERAIFATHPPGAESGALVVVAAADARTPFAHVALSLDGEPLALERWSDSFRAARLPQLAADAPGVLRLEATRASGEVLAHEHVLAR